MQTYGIDADAYNALAPTLMVPPGSHITVATPVAWFGANAAIFQRFYLPVKATYRYVNVNIGTSSGNIEVGVVKLSGAGHLTATKVMTSGLIAAPTAGNWHVDCGATALTPGDYALFFFADNTTITVPARGPDSSLTAAKLVSNATYTSAGVTSGALPAWSNRSIFGLTLEQDV